MSVPTVPQSALLRVPTKQERVDFMLLLRPCAEVFKPDLSPDAVATYFGLLCDVSPLAIAAAAVEIAASRVYSSWPTPGEIRSTAAKLMLQWPTVGQAWKIARFASTRLGDTQYKASGGKLIPMDEWNASVIDALPAPVAATLRIFGGSKLETDGNAYARFRDEYERQCGLAGQVVTRPAVIRALLADKKLQAIGCEKEQT